MDESKPDPARSSPELSARRRRLIEQAARLEADAAPALTAALGLSARLLRANRAEEAAALLRPWHARQPTHPDLAINLGGAYILQRKWEMAVAVLEPAAQAHTGNAMLWANLAAAYLGPLETSGPKQQGQAIAAYGQALAADPKAPNVHYHLGLIYVEQRAWPQAQATFQEAVKLYPQDQDARRWLARIKAVLAEGAGRD